MRTRAPRRSGLIPTQAKQSPPKRTIRARARAFTLVELLVVVAVLAVLGALLFPAFRRAQASARNAGCLANLRQIGTAIVSYASDHDGTLPGPCSTAMNIYDQDVGHLTGTLPLSYYLATYFGVPGGKAEYVSVLQCPAFPFRSLIAPGNWTAATAYVCTYSLPSPVRGSLVANGLQFNPWGRSGDPSVNAMPMKLVAVQSLVNASTTWAVMDGDLTIANTTNPGLSKAPHHSGHWNRLYFDWHAEGTPSSLQYPPY